MRKESIKRLDYSYFTKVVDFFNMDENNKTSIYLHDILKIEKIEQQTQSYLNYKLEIGKFFHLKEYENGVVKMEENKIYYCDYNDVAELYSTYLIIMDIIDNSYSIIFKKLNEKISKYNFKIDNEFEFSCNAEMYNIFYNLLFNDLVFENKLSRFFDNNKLLKPLKTIDSVIDFFNNFIIYDYFEKTPNNKVIVELCKYKDLIKKANDIL